MRKGTGTNVAQGTKLDRTQNYATRGRFPPTPVILCLGVATVSPHFRANLRCVWFGCCFVTVKDPFQGVSGLSETEHCVMAHTLANRPLQLRTVINSLSELCFVLS